MKGNTLFRSLVVMLTLLWSAFADVAHATVVVTPASGGTCLNLSPGSFTTLGNIVITEVSKADFPVQTSTTLILTAPTGFEFQAGAGTVSHVAGNNITSSSISVTNSTITVTISVNNTNRWDILTISGINARATIAGSMGNILRTASGGTATIVGDAPSGGIDHGYLTADATGTTVNSAAPGNWSNPATWVGGSIPACGADVQINHTVTADITATVPNLTIVTGGDLIASNSVSVTNTFTITGTGTYTHSNASDASVGIFSGTETFSSTSNLIMNNWYNNNVPLGSLISGNTGNITFNSTGTWHQDGTFSPSRIQGDLTVSQGIVVMDDGTGASTTLNLNNVTINNTGRLLIAIGTPRDLTLTTNTYVDTSIAVGASGIMYNSYGNLVWTANGDVTINDTWRGLYNFGSIPAANATINVNGNLTLSGGYIVFVDNTDSPLDLTVSGDIIISGSPTRVEFINDGTGDVDITADDIIVSGGINNYLITGTCTGALTVNTTNDLEVTGSGVTLYGLYNTSNTALAEFNIGRDLIVTDSEFFVADSDGDVDLTTMRNIEINGSTGYLGIQENTNNISNIDVSTSGALNITDGTYFHTRGPGVLTLTLAEDLYISNGEFYGVEKNTAAFNNATGVFTMENFDFNGGTAIFANTKTASSTLFTINCRNNFEVNFQANTDQVSLVGYQGGNDAILDLNITGSFIVTGNYPSATFVSSKSDGDETVDIGGDFNVSGGSVFFVNDVGGPGTGDHGIITNISGDMTISGGTTYLSTRTGLADINLSGDFTMTAGTFNVKHEDGTTTLDIGGNYRQTGGTFNLHSGTASTADTVTVTVEGTFVQANSTLNFDNSTGSGIAEHKFILNGSSFYVFGTGGMTHANNLSANTSFGRFIFNRTGTTTYTRFSNTYLVQHVRIYINSQTTVDATGTPYDFLITSHMSSNTVTHNALLVYGTLDMGVRSISARQQPSYYSRLTVYDDGRLRTSNTLGLYSGSFALSTIKTYISGTAALNYDLEPNSVVEVYGTAINMITGVPNGIATGTNQEYGILEINHSGTPGSAWVYPQTTGEVFIRTELRLTAGEFNLDNDHVTNTGGRIINLRNGATISRTTGFIRSETEDGSGTVQWDITANGSYVIPFGYDASNYIPFTFQQTSGSTGILALATYRSAVDNTPYPPTVTHVRDIYGVDNSANTVDRFWKIETTGSPVAGLTFTFVASEGTGIVAPRAQRWEPITRGWYPPAGIQSNPTGTSTLATGINGFNSWWTLSSAANPLPVTLVEFQGKRMNDYNLLEWTTLSELNNDRFEIEKSADGTSFQWIGTVNGNGTTTTPNMYKFRDVNPASGNNYYRLRQVDFDGTASYSNVINIVFRMTGTPLVFPNPALKGTLLSVNDNESVIRIIQVTDMSGKIVLQFQDNGWNSGISTDDLAQGTYLLRFITLDDQVQTHPLVIQ